MHASTVARFVEKVARDAGCWRWTAARDSSGYGMFKVDGAMVGAHRFAWTVANGPIPNGMCVLHRCDNPPCCNPDHLFLGTVSDNNADMTKKGRRVVLRGESKNQSKMTDAKVRELRACGSSVSQREIAAMFGISQRQACDILRRKAWSHVI